MGNVVALREAPQRQTPVRRPNAELRTREHLTQGEVDRLIEAAKGNRHGHRDATMILIAFRHGLRASELVGPDPIQELLESLSGRAGAVASRADVRQGRGARLRLCWSVTLL